AEGLQGDDGVVGVDIARPAERARLFDGDARLDGRWQHLFFVCLVLMLEDFPRRHRDDARLHALGDELFISLDTQTDFRARADQDDIGLAAIAAICQHISAALHAFGTGVLRAVERRHRLAAEHKHGRFVLQLHDHAPRFSHLVAVAGAQNDEAGDRAHRGQLLDGLVRRAVFADTDGVVREDVYGWNLHDRAEAYAAARVVGEDHEARTVGANLREREAV